MAKIWGKNYSKNELLQYIGNINQVAGTKRYELKDGKAFGVRAVDVKTGSGFDFTVLPDRGMDIPFASYKGKSLCLNSKNGVVSSKYYEPEENNWLRSYFAGLLTTCGLSNTCACCEDQGEKYGLHGRISNIPAEKVNVNEYWQDDEFYIDITGMMRESTFYGENLLLTRTITTKLGDKKFLIRDAVENQGYSAVPLMLLYHFNVGFPILDEHCELLMNSAKTDFFDEAAEVGKDALAQFQKPTHEYFRQVFMHTLKQDERGDTLCAAINRELDGGTYGAYLKFNRSQLPEFFEFKMMGQSDYQLGLEPTNCLPMGRAYERSRDGLKYIEAGESKEFVIEVGVIEGEDEAEELARYIRNLQ